MLDNPFVGLRPYEPHEAPLFFGRDELTKELLRRLQRTRFVAVVGSSGSGKSSLIRAGLIPELEAGFLAQERDRWKIMTLKPGDQPLRSLAESVIAVTRPAVNEKQEEVLDTIEQTGLEAEVLDAIEQNGLEAVTDRLQPVLDAGPSNLLVLVDQFEELFTHGSTGQSESTEHRDQVIDFISIMLDLAKFESLPIYVVMTMRSDYIGDCDAFPGLPDAINRSVYLIPRLDRLQRRAVIEGPIRLFGAEITSNLVNALLLEMPDDNDQLPVLQYALMRTWSCWKANGGKGPIDVSSYNQAGRIVGAIKQDAEQAYKTTQAEGLGDLTKRLFQALTRLDANNRAVRRPLRLHELQAITEGKNEEIEQVIKRFCEEDRSFLRWSKDSNPLIDISHESLIRQWDQLHEWVAEEAAAAESYRALERAAKHWERTGNEDDLLKGYDLEQALDWYNRDHFKSAWATRYGTAFALAIRCLEASQKTREQERVREDERRREQENYERQKRDNRRLQWALCIGVVVICVIAYLLADVQRKTAELSQVNTKLEQAIAELKDKSSELEKANEKLKRREREATNWRKQTEASTLVLEALKKRESHPPLASQLAFLAAVKSYTIKRETSDFWDISIDVWEIPKDLKRAIQPLLMDKPQIGHLRGHTDEILAVAVNADGKRIATAGTDFTVKIWDAELGLPIITLGGREKQGHNTLVQDVAFHPKKDRVVVTASNESVAIWDTQAGSLIQRRGAKSVAFSSDGAVLVVGGCPVTLYETETWQEIWPKDTPFECPDNRPFSPDDVKLPVAAFGQHNAEIVVGNPEGRVQVINTQNGQVKYLPASETGLRAHEHPVQKIASVISAQDGLRIATTDGQGVVRIWDLVHHQHLREFKVDADLIHGLALSADGQRVAVSSGDGAITVWDIQTGEMMMTNSTLHRGYTKDVAFAPDGSWVVSADTEGMLLITDAVSGKPKRQIDLHKAELTSVVRSADGRRLATVSVDDTTRVWAAEGMSLLHTLSPRHTAAIYGVEVSPNGRLLATASGDGTAKLWENNKSWNLQRTLVGHTDRVYDVSFSPDGKWLATASKDGTVRLWDTEKCLQGAACELQKFPHPQGVYDVEFAPDGKSIATACADRKIRLWDVHANAETPQTTFAEHTDRVLDVEFSRDGQYLATASYDRTARLRNLVTGEVRILPHDDYLEAVSFNSTGDQVATGDVSGQVRIWSVTSDESALLPKPPGSSRIYALKYSPDGQSLAVGLNTGLIGRWDLRNSRWMEPLFHGGKVYRLAFEPQGQYLFTASSDRNVYIWDLYRPEVKPEGLQPSHTTTAALSPNGEQILLGDINGHIKLWDLSGQTANLVQEVKAHTAPITSIAYHPESRWVATSGERVQLWRLQADGLQEFLPQSQQAPQLDTMQVHRIVFSPDGSKFLAHSRNGTASLWKLDGKEGVKELLPLVTDEAKLITAAFSPDGDKLVAVLTWEKKAKTEARLYSFGAETPQYDLLDNLLKEHKTSLIHVSFSPDGKRVATMDTESNMVIWDWKSEAPAVLFELSSGMNMTPTTVYFGGKHGDSVDIFTKDGRQIQYKGIHGYFEDKQILEELQRRSDQLEHEVCKSYMKENRYLKYLPIDDEDIKLLHDKLNLIFKNVCW